MKSLFFSSVFFLLLITQVSAQTETTSPKFEIKGKTLIERYNYKEGKELGIKLKEIEDFWIENSFKISDNDIDKIVKN